MTGFTRFTPLISGLPATVPFVGPEAIERQRGRPVLARIGANESGFGPAPSVLAAIREKAGEIWKYNDPENFALKTALAAHLKLSPANFVIGEGVDDLLGLIVRLVIEPGMPVVTSFGGYPTFNFHVNGFGGRLVTTPYVNDREDLDGLLAAVKRENAPLVYFANPDNPMSTWWSGAEVARELARVPAGSVFVLDEAYVEFAPEGTAPVIDADDPRVIRFRTFSKAYGMAGLRVAYGITAPEIASAYDKIRNHFGVNRIAQAGALASLADRDWLAHVIGVVNRAKARIAEIARTNGLAPLPSATNFVTVDCGGDAAFARRVLDGLVARDVFVRKPWMPPMDRCIRISAGNDADMDRLAAAMPGALADARA